MAFLHVKITLITILKNKTYINFITFWHYFKKNNCSIIGVKHLVKLNLWFVHVFLHFEIAKCSPYNILSLSFSLSCLQKNIILMIRSEVRQLLLCNINKSYCAHISRLLDLQAHDQLASLKTLCLHLNRVKCKSIHVKKIASEEVAMSGYKIAK